MPGFVRVFLLTCVVAAAAAPAFGQAIRDRPTISVSGTAELEAAPDLIEWQVEVVDNHVNPAEAKARNDARYEALLEIADDLDMEAEDIIAGLVSVRKTYERDDRGRRGAFKDYELRRRVTLRLRDFDAFDAMLQRLAESGFEFSIAYSTTQVHTMKREARVEAVRVAREKAVEMAEVLGQEVGRPLVIEEYGARFAGFDLNDALSNTNSAGRFGDEPVGPRLRQGAISVTASVSVVFELVQPE